MCQSLEATPETPPPKTKKNLNTVFSRAGASAAGTKRKLEFSHNYAREHGFNDFSWFADWLVFIGIVFILRSVEIWKATTIVGLVW